MTNDWGTDLEWIPRGRRRDVRSPSSTFYPTIWTRIVECLVGYERRLHLSVASCHRPVPSSLGTWGVLMTTDCHVHLISFTQ